MLKFSEIIKNTSKDTKIIEDYARRKGYQDKIIEHRISEAKEFEPVEIDNPESITEYFDRMLTQHIEAVVQDYRDERAAKEYKADKVKL